MRTDTDPLLVRLCEAASVLNVSVGTLHKLIRDGRLPVVRVARRTVRVPLAALHEFASRGGRAADELDPAHAQAGL